MDDEDNNYLFECINLKLFSDGTKACFNIDRQKVKKD